MAESILRGKILAYDPASGAGTVRAGGKNRSFTIGGWEDDDAAPEVGMDIKIKVNEDGAVVAIKQDSKTSSATPTPKSATPNPKHEEMKARLLEDEVARMEDRELARKHRNKGFNLMLIGGIMTLIGMFSVGLYEMSGGPKGSLIALVNAIVFFGGIGLFMFGRLVMIWGVAGGVYNR